MGTITSCVIDELSQCVNSSPLSYDGSEFQMYVDRSGIQREFNPTLKSNGNEELQYIAQRDSYIMIPGDDWYLINVDWLALWLEYAKNATTEQPGKISNTDLIDETNPKKMKPNMMVKRDFRCVCKEVWNYLFERHGGGPILYFIVPSGYPEKSYKTGEWIKKTNMEEYVTIIYPHTFTKSKPVAIDASIEALDHRPRNIATENSSSPPATTTTTTTTTSNSRSTISIVSINGYQHSHIINIIKIQKAFRKYSHNKKTKYHDNIMRNNKSSISHPTSTCLLTEEQKQQLFVSSLKITSIIKLKCALNRKKIILQKFPQTFKFQIKKIDHISLNNLSDNKNSYHNKPTHANNDNNKHNIYMLVSGAILNTSRNSPIKKGNFNYVSQYRTKTLSYDSSLNSNNNDNDSNANANSTNNTTADASNKLVWSEGGLICAVNGYSDILVTIWVTVNSTATTTTGAAAGTVPSGNTTPTNSPSRAPRSSSTHSPSSSNTNSSSATSPSTVRHREEGSSMIGQVRIPVAHYYSSLFYQQPTTLSLPIEFMESVKLDNPNTPDRKLNSNNKSNEANAAKGNLTIDLKLLKFESTLSGWVWMRSSLQTTSQWHKVWAVHQDKELTWFDSPMALHSPLGVIYDSQINKIDDCEQGGLLCLFLGVTLKSDVDAYLLMHWMERGSTGSPSDGGRIKEKRQNSFIDMTDRFNNRVTWLRRLRLCCRQK